MLLELRAENYAVIDRAAARFGRGLNLLTGETGAGKSILIDALALLLGGKASADFIRHGAEKAVVGCVFEATPGAIAVLEANGIDADSESEGILLRREIVVSGKGRVFINNQPATVGVLRLLAPELALVHAQGETLGAFDQAQQRILLDRFAGCSLEEVGKAYSAWRGTVAKLEEMNSAEQDRLRMADLWRFQSMEISDAGIAGESEDAELEGEKRVLANAEKLYTAAMNAHELLYESEDSAETKLGAALKLVEELARYDARFVEAAGQLAAAKATVEDLSATVRDFAENVQSGPERLAEIEDRLAVLDRLKRKYGKTLAEVIAFGESSARSLAEVENRDALLAELRVVEAKQAESYCAAAGELTRVRGEAAAKLERLAEKQINDLAMSVRFSIQVLANEERVHWGAGGWDEVRYLIATNAGEPLKPLEEIASGGEMSRVMLALKVTVEEGVAGRGSKRKTALPRTLVFDEIDIGIGGRAAEAVGQKLKMLSRTQQVLCITHLPQIAAFGDLHFVIEKKEVGGRTQTNIRQMEDVERVNEVARMLSGAKLTETSLKHAQSLIDASR
ncbi:DNA repair protein RecN [Granulicella tundricola]|uniref:DNA repair protein RecN n=1 Tax=Granulicella tundricola (strain ATCC BAA-1859 / DSM 23138 / MP5ACTX9) TaxID=1198114 RepID=E8WXM7_GRATM|nr:DNA repair protein RecN [Granulicella tundricola]ADW68643.1 DNA repair protein RecN [Granulicella tundricola MP5ACTX9]